MSKIVLRDYQVNAKTALREMFSSGHKRSLITLPTASGKCLAKGTRIIMFDGSIKEVQNIVNGDLVMGTDSTSREVCGVTSGQEEMFKITPVKGASYTVNKSHILSFKITGRDNVTAGDGKKYKAKSICNISVEDYNKSSKTFKHVAKGWRTGVKDFGGEKVLEIPPYILGLWLGDGFSRQATICNCDNEVVEAWSEYAKSINHVITKFDEDRAPCYRIKAPNGIKSPRGRRRNLVKNFLFDNNLLENKHIPFNYKTADYNSRLELLAGMLDTDGYASNDSCYDVVFKQKQLAEDMVFVVRSVGLAAYMKECQKTATNTGATGTYYRISISGKTHIVPCKVERRKIPNKFKRKSALVTGVKVESVGHGDYYGFELSGKDRLFLLDDFTVTHNTVFFVDLTRATVERGKTVTILVHRQELLQQTSDTLTAFGVEHSLISPGSKVYNTPVQVAMIQTLNRRLDKWKKPDLLICDEAHLSRAASWKKVIDSVEGYVLGVTATPCRLDGKPLGDIYSKMWVGPSTGDMIKKWLFIKIHCLSWRRS